ncbi:hypothetical protein PSAB6_460046 [Paraburkholderia sabiae]|nr:hypothetical protein PSAB6_460046 [Paraburkholderia sabiae]
MHTLIRRDLVVRGCGYNKEMRLMATDKQSGPHTTSWMWVGLRQPALQFHRRKAASGISWPGSGQASARTPT